MRTDPSEIEFSNYLLKLGNGEEDIVEDVGEWCIKIPDKHLVHSSEGLINSVFQNLGNYQHNQDCITNGAIYTPLNKDMTSINDHCLNKFPGEMKEYLSADTIWEDDHQEAVPTEYLNMMTPSGLPDHSLKLKVNCPVMLLRNLQAGKTYISFLVI